MILQLMVQETSRNGTDLRHCQQLQIGVLSRVLFYEDLVRSTDRLMNEVSGQLDGPDTKRYIVGTKLKREYTAFQGCSTPVWMIETQLKGGGEFNGKKVNVFNQDRIKLNNSTYVLLKDGYYWYGGTVD